MTFFNSQFHKKTISIPEDCEVVCVADLFAEEYTGGAELTTEALIKSSPFKIFKLHSKNVSLDLLEKGQNKFWIFFNYSQMNLELIPSIAANMNYSIVEYDYKICQYRSPGKHIAATGNCDCSENEGMHAKLIATFMAGSKSNWFMSEKQHDYYQKKLPFISEKPAVVLSSVFDDETFATIKILRENYKGKKNNKFLIQSSESWIKGTEDCIQYAEKNKLEYEIISGLSYGDMLEKLAQSKGLIFMPRADDTCPRIVLEASLLGCKLILNEHVGHQSEEWFEPLMNFNNKTE